MYMFFTPKHARVKIPTLAVEAAVDRTAESEPEPEPEVGRTAAGAETVERAETAAQTAAADIAAERVEVETAARPAAARTEARAGRIGVEIAVAIEAETAVAIEAETVADHIAAAEPPRTKTTGQTGRQS